VYVEKAQGAARACETFYGPDQWALGHPPSLSQGSPSAAILQTFAVLRRPATPSDHLPPRIIGPPHRHVYSKGAVPDVRGVYIRYVRKARHRFGGDWYLVPAANVNTTAPFTAACAREMGSQLRRELPRIPVRLRPAALAVLPGYVAYLRAAMKPYPGVCLVAINDTGNGDGCSAYGLSQIASGHTLSRGAPAGVGVVYGLAPDGVSTVTFDYRGQYPGRPLTVRVIDNVFILRDTRDRLPGDGFPDRLVWHSASGAVLKTVTWPR
jgi:hypothetical protein